MQSSLKFLLFTGIVVGLAAAQLEHGIPGALHEAVAPRVVLVVFQIPLVRKQAESFVLVDAPYAASAINI